MRRAEPIAAVSLLCLLAAPADAAETRRFDIAAGRLADGLIALAEQARITIGASDPALLRIRSPAVRGRLTIDQALQRLLAGSGYAYRFVAPDAVRIVAARAPGHPPSALRQPQPEPAQPEPAQPEIIVTASKQRTPLGNYAGTANVLALDPSEASRIGGHGSDAILEQLPMLASTSLGPGRNKLYIRGVADSSFNGPSQSIVGQYLGDVRLTFNAPDPDLRLYDIKSVELLEGPQGTLYGSGSLGGILRLVPNSPDLSQLTASASAGLLGTRHGGRGGDLSMISNVPIVADRLALRAVGYGLIEPGYIDDLQRGLRDVNRTTVKGARASLLFEPRSDWQFEVGGVAQYIANRDGQYATRGLGLARRSNLAQPFDNDYLVAQATIRKHSPSFEIVSASAVVRHTLETKFDATGFPDTVGPQLFTEDVRITLISNETRISQSRADGGGWLAGWSLLHNVNSLSRSLGPPGTSNAIAGVHNDTTEGALFGQYSLALSPNLTATFGGRLTYSRAVGRPLGTAEGLDEPKRTDIRASPTAALAWRPSAGLLLYSRYQQGFRAGGLAVSASSTGIAAQRFQSDALSSVEAGVRFGRADVDRISFDASVSYTRWEDIQADLIDTRGLPYTTNIGDGRIYGLEAEISWRASREFQLDIATFINDSALVSPRAEFADADERDLPNISMAGARVSGRFVTEVSATTTLAIDGSLRYFGKSRLGIGPILDIPQGDFVESRAGARLDFGRFGLSLDVTNLGDVEGNRFSFGNPFGVAGRTQVTPLRPRTVRIGVDARF
ncbi:MAG: TonB-dependent receptor [Alphaproteobacteria bacterium]|nr:TonB-dependent receptor [Alphaproteobacteria bacterium]